jgi:hypothetical protein
MSKKRRLVKINKIGFFDESQISEKLEVMKSLYMDRYEEDGVFRVDFAEIESNREVISVAVFFNGNLSKQESSFFIKLYPDENSFQYSIHLGGFGIYSITKTILTGMSLFELWDLLYRIEVYSFFNPSSAGIEFVNHTERAELADGVISLFPDSLSFGNGFDGKTIAIVGHLHYLDEKMNKVSLPILVERVGSNE